MNCFKKKETICINCINSVPNPEKGTGCNWSRWFMPVDGWEAEETLIVNRPLCDEEEECTIPSYRVISCPSFDSDESQYAKPIRGKLKKGIDPYSLKALRCNGQNVAI